MKKDILICKKDTELCVIIKLKLEDHGFEESLIDTTRPFHKQTKNKDLEIIDHTHSSRVITESL